MAAGEGGAEGLQVEDVGAAHGEPLPGALQRKQVRVLAVLCQNKKMSTLIIQRYSEFVTVQMKEH
jgi:hypothetical protein